ncbi:hypothetical protein GP486_001144 [Trichoglossum hirsutum]|uniref:Uncharacterized protein n=1 Tax=Trichoglossum hirsutum TaxID=265104 RepID=A0A9P8LHL8_9PEZI|nr:hypothetical protein GP486_001144 [Trichoglossum hirsutum]
MNGHQTHTSAGHGMVICSAYGGTLKNGDESAGEAEDRAEDNETPDDPDEAWYDKDAAIEEEDGNFGEGDGSLVGYLDGEEELWCVVSISTEGGRTAVIGEGCVGRTFNALRRRSCGMS